LNSIIAPRLEETFELLRQDIARHGALEAITRVVLTGGGSQMQGMRDFAGHHFGCAVRLGQPVLGQGAPESAQQGGMAVSAGLMALSLKPDRRLAMPTEARERIERQQMGYARRVGRWLKEAL
jgi:cell division protein FtsA